MHVSSSSDGSNITRSFCMLSTLPRCFRIFCILETLHIEITTSGGGYKAVLDVKVGGVSKVFTGKLPGNEHCKHIVGEFSGDPIVNPPQTSGGGWISRCSRPHQGKQSDPEILLPSCYQEKWGENARNIPVLNALWEKTSVQFVLERLTVGSSSLLLLPHRIGCYEDWSGTESSVFSKYLSIVAWESGQLWRGPFWHVTSVRPWTGRTQTGLGRLCVYKIIGELGLLFRRGLPAGLSLRSSCDSNLHWIHGPNTLFLHVDEP